MSVKKMVIIIDGDIEAGTMGDVISQGLQFYEDIKWTSFNVREVSIDYGNGN
ncbi:hypothetical protein PSYJYH_000044 [Bacillus phage PSYJ-YH]|nr:hypothetical protein PSYJYH_000044 [Bacillus phage PSYJ-YH]